MDSAQDMPSLKPPTQYCTTLNDMTAIDWTVQWSKLLARQKKGELKVQITVPHPGEGDSQS